MSESPAQRAQMAQIPARVLVIEAGATRRQQLALALAPAYQMTTAETADQGMAEALREPPALVVLGLRTPADAAGWLHRLREEASLKDTPVLLVADGADEPQVLSLLDGKADDFVIPPISGKIVLLRARNLIAARLTRDKIESLRASAVSANQAKDEFLAMLGHELRNPLSPILTALQLMKLQGPEAAESARAVIERQVNHLTRLVDDLLDVSRIARGKVELRIEPVEISEVVAKAVEMASPLLEQNRHSLLVEVPRRGLRVNGDPARLRQVVSNLLTNAAKYTPAGGRVQLSAAAEGGEVVLRVRDNGLGIRTEALPYIFESFVQEPQSIARSQGGLGIGLTIVRNLVAQHHGTVTAHSAGPGQGSEFTVRLPLAAPVTAAAAPVPEPVVPERKPVAAGPRVLIVDDNEDGAQMLAVLLRVKGYEVQVAFDAPTALRIALEFSPEVAFLDIGLPVMDGYELAMHLREIPSLAATRLVAVTGYGQDSDRMKTRAAGFDDHLVKPVDISALEAVLQDYQSPPPRAPDAGGPRRTH